MFWDVSDGFKFLRNSTSLILIMSSRIQFIPRQNCAKTENLQNLKTLRVGGGEQFKICALLSPPEDTMTGILVQSIYLTHFVSWIPNQNLFILTVLLWGVTMMDR